MKLLVKINNQWQYVFCRNSQTTDPVVTDDKNKAIPGHQHSLGYFSRMYANHQFKLGVL